jgi:hypothetical protein
MIIVHPERQPEPIVQPTSVIMPDLSHSVLKRPTVYENIDVPEPKIVVKPIINEIGPGAHKVKVEPIQDTCEVNDWWVMGNKFILGAASLINLYNLVSTWSTNYPRVAGKKLFI